MVKIIIRFSPLTGTLSKADRLRGMRIITEWARRLKFAAEDNDHESWAQDFAKKACFGVSSPSPCGSFHGDAGGNEGTR